MYSTGRTHSNTALGTGNGRARILSAGGHRDVFRDQAYCRSLLRPASSQHTAQFKHKQFHLSVMPAPGKPSREQRSTTLLSPTMTVQTCGQVGGSLWKPKAEGARTPEHGCTVLTRSRHGRLTDPGRYREGKSLPVS